MIEQCRTKARERPRVFVEAPEEIIRQELDHLPASMHLGPGRIVVEAFATPEEAKQKLLALILTIGNDPNGFDDRIAVDSSPG